MGQSGSKRQSRAGAQGETSRAAPSRAAPFRARAAHVNAIVPGCSPVSYQGVVAPRGLTTPPQSAKALLGAICSHPGIFFQGRFHTIKRIYFFMAAKTLLQVRVLGDLSLTWLSPPHTNSLKFKLNS